MPYYCRGMEIETSVMSQIYGPVGYIDRDRAGGVDKQCAKREILGRVDMGGNGEPVGKREVVGRPFSA